MRNINVLSMFISNFHQPHLNILRTAVFIIFGSVTVIYKRRPILVQYLRHVVQMR